MCNHRFPKQSKKPIQISLKQKSKTQTLTTEINRSLIYIKIRLTLSWRRCGPISKMAHTNPCHIYKIEQTMQRFNRMPSYNDTSLMIDTVIRTRVFYSFYTIPYSMPTIKKLDKRIIATQKTMCGLSKCTANVVTQLPHDMFGLEAFSFKTGYLQCIGEQLLNDLYDKGRLGKIYKRLVHYILAKYGEAKNLPRIKSLDCYRSPITRTFILLKTEGKIHLKSTLEKSLIDPTPLEMIWLHEATTFPQLTEQTLKDYSKNSLSIISQL